MCLLKKRKAQKMRGRIVRSLNLEDYVIFLRVSVLLYVFRLCSGNNMVDRFRLDFLGSCLDIHTQSVASTSPPCLSQLSQVV